LKRIDQAYKVAEQFDRWRQRAVPEELADEGKDRPKRGPIWRFMSVSLPIVLLVLLFLPYEYEPGGEFTVYPSQQLQVATDEPGVITNVYFDGGEYVKKGVVLARLASTDLVAQVRTLEAKMVEQQAHIDDLKARPKPEAVKVAEAELETARNAVVFSVERVARLVVLVRDGAVTQEEYEAARKQAKHDQDAVVQREAELALVRTGATAEEIAAAEAQLVSLREQRDMYQERVTRTVLSMPIDGNILTLHLMKKFNSFLDKGQPFASVEDPTLMSAEIEVPESGARYLKLGATVELRANAFFDTPFEGKVSIIDRNVTTKSFGSVLKVIVLVKNPDGLLRTGMRGYAKLAGVTMPVWRAFSMAVMSFFEVHVWSWIP
jgi:putative peptide zinc metalloprotease protein